MAKNRWYDGREETFLRQRVRQLDLGRQPYGSRRDVYRQVAGELAERFGVVRSWQGIQQRVRRLLRHESDAL